MRKAFFGLQDLGKGDALVLAIPDSSIAPMKLMQ